jgi:hypothetical protein
MKKQIGFPKHCDRNSARVNGTKESAIEYCELRAEERRIITKLGEATRIHLAPERIADIRESMAGIVGKYEQLATTAHNPYQRQLAQHRADYLAEILESPALDHALTADDRIPLQL